MSRVRLVDGPLHGLTVELIDEPRVGDVVPLPMSSPASPVYVIASPTEARYAPQTPAKNSPESSSK